MRPLCGHTAPINLYGALLGALMPDVGYYLGPIGRDLSAHTLPGLFAICLPFAWLFLLLSLVFARAMFQVLPAPHGAFLLALWEQVLSSMRWQPKALVVLSAFMVFGSFSHVLWDSATHRTGGLVPLLNLTHSLFGVPLYRWLQHLSTVLGSLVLLAWYRSSLKQFQVQHPIARDQKAVTAVAVLLALIAAFAAYSAWKIAAPLPKALQLRAFFFQAAVLAAQLSLVSWVLIAGLNRIVGRSRA